MIVYAIIITAIAVFELYLLVKRPVHGKTRDEYMRRIADLEKKIELRNGAIKDVREKVRRVTDESCPDTIGELGVMFGGIDK